MAFLPKSLSLSPKKRRGSKKVLQKNPGALQEQLELFRQFRNQDGRRKSITSETLMKEFARIMSEDGVRVIKHGRQGDPHMRNLYLKEKTMELAWQQPNGEPGQMKGGPLYMHDCWSVRSGLEVDPWTVGSPDHDVPLLGTAVLRESCSPDNAPLAVSLLWNHRTVDMQVDSRLFCQYLNWCFEALRKRAKQQQAIQVLQDLVPKPDDESIMTPEKEEEMMTRIRRQSLTLANIVNEADADNEQTHIDYLHSIRKVSDMEDDDEDDDEEDNGVVVKHVNLDSSRGVDRGVLLSIDSDGD